MGRWWWCVIVIFLWWYWWYCHQIRKVKGQELVSVGCKEIITVSSVSPKEWGMWAKPWHFTKHPSPNPIHVYHTQLSFSESELLSQFQNVSNWTKDKIQNITRDSKGFPYLLFQRKIGFEIGHDWLLSLVLPV